MEISPLDTILRQYPLDLRDLAFRPVRSGEENASFAIAAGGERYFLRLYSLDHSTTGRRSEDEIEGELDFIDHTRRHGVPTPGIIPTRDGARFARVEIDGLPRFAALFEYAAGVEADGYTPERARAAAGLLMLMRRASITFRPVRARKWQGSMVETSLGLYRQHRQKVGAYRAALDGIAEGVMEDYKKVQPDLPLGVIHGDIKLGNLLFDDGELRAVIDFDDYHASFLVEEIARTVMHDLDSPTRNVIRAGMFDAFRAAFHQDGSVSSAERGALLVFLRARFVYDVTTYLLAGLSGLVEVLFLDEHVTEVLELIRKTKRLSKKSSSGK